MGTEVHHVDGMRWMPRVHVLTTSSVSTPTKPSTLSTPCPFVTPPASHVSELVRRPLKDLGNQMRGVVSVRRLCCMHALAASTLATMVPTIFAAATTVRDLVC